VVTQEAVFRQFPGAVKATDGVVEVVMIPEGGRVISAGLVGGSGNLLWVNPGVGSPGLVSKDPSKWNNYGGDKTWAWPQSDWGKLFGYDWPPAIAFDQAAFVLSGIKTGIRADGPVSEKEGMRVVREVRLMGGGVLPDGRRFGRLRVSSRIEAVGVGNAHPVGVWHVTQLPWPTEVTIEGVKGGEGSGWEWMNDKTVWPGVSQRGETVVLPGGSGGGAKIGADGSQLVWKGPGGQEIRQRVVGANAGDLKPQEQLQVYRSENTGNPGDYIELEITSPRVEVRPGRPAELVVEWELIEPKK
jgi:hypothetical protein